MSTHEREITEPVDLCLPGGRRLAPGARGWSRRPLHTANLRGRWGRTKRWDYWAVLADGLTLSLTFADVDYIGLVGVWWADLASGRTGGREIATPAARGVSLPDLPASAPLRYDSSRIAVDIVDDPAGTTITARWRERDGSPARLDLRVDSPEGHESLNVVIPWSETTFQFTSKHQARPARGTLEVGSESWSFGADLPAWGVLDVGRGRWPYSTRWNWGGGAGETADGCTVGLQFGGRWTEGTGFTENGVIIDGRLDKIGAELLWTYDWDRPLQPWRVRHPDGSIDLTLTPVHDKHTALNALVLRTEVHQVFGTWAGTVGGADGAVHRLEGALGFAEESRSRW